MNIKKYFFLSVLAFVFAFSFAGKALAADLNADINSDNHYQFYISTDDSVLGTFIGQSNGWGIPTLDPPHDWEDAEAWDGLVLTAGVTNYLHIIGVDDTGYSSGILGSFDLTNPNFAFDNGTSHLITNATDWKAFIDAFGGTATPVVVTGTNGDAPWGSFGTIDATSKWIWTNQDGNGDINSTRYFSARINPVVVPEPISSALFLLGGSALAARRLKKKQS